VRARQLAERRPRIVAGFAGMLLLAMAMAAEAQQDGAPVVKLDKVEVRGSNIARLGEIELVRAYLGIVRLRLGERLAFEIETPGEIADARVPPMMLLLLVDHAIAQGVAQPQTTGSIRIGTVLADGKVRLAISDSGAASLELRRVDERATEAIVELPVDAPAHTGEFDALSTGPSRAGT
jgi:hypothetical protein